MRLVYDYEYGTVYDENFKNSILTEPTYFDIDAHGNFPLIVDGNKQFRFFGKLLEREDWVDIGNPMAGRPLIMDREGNFIAYSTERIRFSWEQELDPETIHILDEDRALLTLRKKQKVILIDASGKIIWSFGKDRKPGSGQLNVPMYSCYLLQSNTVLIADSINSRVLEVDLNGKILWQYGEAGTLGSEGQLLWKPTCAKRLPNGDTVIADSKNRRIIRVTREKTVVSSLGEATIKRLILTYPRSVEELADGTFLIANTHSNALVRIDSDMSRMIDFYENIGNPFYWPRCTATNMNRSEIVVCDGLNNRLVLLEYPTFEEKHNLMQCQSGDSFLPLGDPHHLEINKTTGHYLVTLTENNEVIELSRSGKLVRKWGGLQDPHSAKYIENGIVIADSDKHRITLHFDDQTIQHISSFVNSRGDVETFHRPRFATKYREGYLVMDTGNQRIVYIESKQSGVWNGKVVEIDFPPNVISSLCNPRWIYIRENGSLIITDTENCRIIHCTVASDGL
ncbi:PQQ-binding-like beta-propeller repeat protein [Cohnella panacarvi]|uniref:outer membrane protein assembly factor BamB family protein n=1 Tax=Cohnella panacarvi TaxID=400776 RepID=UPI00047D3B10|nr:hypothetical protein [Cohnella panacarvi]